MQHIFWICVSQDFKYLEVNILCQFSYKKMFFKTIGIFYIFDSWSGNQISGDQKVIFFCRNGQYL